MNDDYSAWDAITFLMFALADVLVSVTVSVTFNLLLSY